MLIARQLKAWLHLFARLAIDGHFGSRRKCAVVRARNPSLLHSQCESVWLGAISKVPVLPRDDLAGLHALRAAYTGPDA